MDWKALLRPHMSLTAMHRAGIALALTLLGVPSVRAADVHPWCMIYQDMSGAMACYYDTYDQCRTGAAGANAGTCLQNPAYREASAPAPTAARKARRPR
jgi:hypothetical protein